MKRLYILRHAKAAPGEPGQDDHARALTLRGVADAEAVARYLNKNGAEPERVLVSTSARTVQTADLVLRELASPPRADYRDGLYLAEAGKILAMIQGLPARTGTVMVIGHNPGLEELATLLAREPVRRKERERRDQNQRDAEEVQLRSIEHSHGNVFAAAPLPGADILVVVLEAP